MRKTICISLLLLLAGCTGISLTGAPPVSRMYVIECGENHVKDLSRWTPGVNVGKAHVFSDHCYLIRHAKGWFLWDSGNSDSLAALPNGRTAPNGIITAFMRKPLVESLKELGLTPDDIRYFAMSHSHGDHSGNANLSGDMVHLMYSWERNIVPSFNYNVEQSRQTILAMKEFVKQTGAQIWVSHDKEQHALIPKSPNFIE
jgi:N-acyl homoserine lactone hydrolase